MRICSVEGCDKKHTAKGLCAMHYRRQSLYGSNDLPEKSVPHCSVQGCNRKHYGHGYCNLHMNRIKAHGSTDRKPLPTMPERFWAKVDKTGDCWLWTAAMYADGYGSFSVGGNVSRRAHRVSWEMTNGAIPHGLIVCHTCDTPTCVNPAHLFLGTVKDNHNDMMSKGRHRPRKGERASSAKLTDQQVREILQSSDTGMELAAVYGVCHQQISAIKRGRYWKHIA